VLDAFENNFGGGVRDERSRYQRRSDCVVLSEYHYPPPAKAYHRRRRRRRHRSSPSSRPNERVHTIIII